MAKATFQIAGKVCPGGDKYRITIIDFPAVQNWLSQTEDPNGFFLDAILIVPCTQHCRLEDITPDGKWARTVPRGKKRKGYYPPFDYHHFTPS